MTFLNRLENRFPWFAIPGLIRFVALFNALVFLLHLIAPGYESVLTLNREAILQGEIWRLITWIFIPETFQPFWILFALLFLWFLGDGLEEALGAFRTTLFYLTGVIACTAVALIFGSYGANTFLNLSLLYAFATLHPNYQVFLFFIIPVRMSWLAIFSFLLAAVGTLGQSNATKAALVATLINYSLFFWSILFSQRGHSFVTRFKKRDLPLLKRRKNPSEEEETFHCCVICRRTDKTTPDLNFRVADNGQEYCTEHLPLCSNNEN